MRLLCINSDLIMTSDGLPTLGGGLQEGVIYTSDGEIYDGLSDTVAKCYFINELHQLKRCERFLVLSDEDADSSEAESIQKETEN